MKILARHLTVDLFNCKNSKLKDIDQIKEYTKEIPEHFALHKISECSEHLTDTHYAIMTLFREGHMVLHIYTELKYVAIDIFLCQENAEPERIAKDMRDFFKPDKTKTTRLKRGDFGSAKDIRPKVKTRVAPLRKLPHTG
uniref:S-adenosylmethionine decarboxylase family protein n=1 Tax=Mitsuokella sp. TaxID=2049034 RepID=UPI003D7C8A73